MIQLLSVSNQPNVPTKQYYLESEEEINDIKDASVGSTALILTENGLKVKMLHSSGRWIEI